MYFQSTNVNFNEKPMWIHESLIVAGITYHPIIVMGAFNNYYCVIILEGEFGLI
jgi:hypothetical protein